MICMVIMNNMAHALHRTYSITQLVFSDSVNSVSGKLSGAHTYVHTCIAVSQLDCKTFGPVGLHQPSTN